MSAQELQSAISELSAEELARFSASFEEFKADQWDRQIKEDAKAGRLDHLAKRAIEEYKSGQYTLLP